MPRTPVVGDNLLSPGRIHDLIWGYLVYFYSTTCLRAIFTCCQSLPCNGSVVLGHASFTMLILHTCRKTHERKTYRTIQVLLHIFASLCGGQDLIIGTGNRMCLPQNNVPLNGGKSHTTRSSNSIFLNLRALDHNLKVNHQQKAG